MRPTLNVDNSTPAQINTALASNLKNVIRWSSPVTVYNPTVGSAVVVLHDLNSQPTTIDITPMVDCRWWVDQDDAAVWSKTQIQFHCSHKGQYTVRAGVQ